MKRSSPRQTKRILSTTFPWDHRDDKHVCCFASTYERVLLHHEYPAAPPAHSPLIAILFQYGPIGLDVDVRNDGGFPSASAPKRISVCLCPCPYLESLQEGACTADTATPHSSHRTVQREANASIGQGTEPLYWYFTLFGCPATITGWTQLELHKLPHTVSSDRPEALNEVHAAASTSRATRQRSGQAVVGRRALPKSGLYKDGFFLHPHPHPTLVPIATTTLSSSVESPTSVIHTNIPQHLLLAKHHMAPGKYVIPLDETALI